MAFHPDAIDAWRRAIDDEVYAHWLQVYKRHAEAFRKAFEPQLRARGHKRLASHVTKEPAMTFADKARKARDKGKIVVIFDQDNGYYASVKGVTVYDWDGIEAVKAQVQTGKAFDKFLDSTEDEDEDEDEYVGEED